jgi:hypothetical protein
MARAAAVPGDRRPERGAVAVAPVVSGGPDPVRHRLRSRVRHQVKRGQAVRRFARSRVIGRAGSAVRGWPQARGEAARAQSPHQPPCLAAHVHVRLDGDRAAAPHHDYTPTQLDDH